MYVTTNLSLPNNYVSIIVYTHVNILIITDEVHIKINIKKCTQIVLFVL